MKTARCGTFARLLIAITVSSIGATALPAQDYVRDSAPKLFSYDELVQLSLDPAFLRNCNDRRDVLRS